MVCILFIIFRAAVNTLSMPLPVRTRRLLYRDVESRRYQRVFGLLLLLVVAAFFSSTSYKRQRAEVEKRRARYSVVRGQVMHVEHTYDATTGSAYVDDLVVTYEMTPGEQTTRTFDYKHDVTSDDVLPQVGDSVYVSYDVANPADAFVMPLKPASTSAPPPQRQIYVPT